jgi:hypothetical protein
VRPEKESNSSRQVKEPKYQKKTPDKGKVGSIVVHFEIVHFYRRTEGFLALANHRLKLLVQALKTSILFTLSAA